MEEVKKQSRFTRLKYNEAKMGAIRSIAGI